MKCMNIFKKPSLFTQSREESRGPLCWWNQKLLCQAPFFATPSTLIPYQSAPAPLPLHALQKWGKGTNIYKTLQHAGSLPGDFLFVVLLNSQSKHNSACVIEKMRLSEASPGYLSLLCVLRHLQSKVEKPFHIPLTPGSLPPALTFIFLNTWTFSCLYLPWSLSSICQGWPDLLLDFHGPMLLLCFLPLSGPLLARLWALAFPALSCLSLIQLYSPSGSGLLSWLWRPSAC